MPETRGQPSLTAHVWAAQPMSSRTNRIARRGWVALGFAFAALLLPMLLNALGFAHYESTRGGSDPSRPADLGLAERICLVSEWMVPGGVFAWAAALFRLRYPVLFDRESRGGRILPVVLGVAGLALLIERWIRWGPHTGLHFTAFQGWEFGVGWLLLWWCFVFVRTGASDESVIADRRGSAD